MTMDAKSMANTFYEVFDFCTAGMAPPNRLIFGCGAVEQIGSEAAKLAQGKVLLVSDSTLEGIGVVGRVADSLSSAGLESTSFTEVEPEPHLETVETLYEKCRSEGCALILGVGGGSVMDVAKLTAQSAARGASPRDYINGKVAAESRGLPLILTPTTAGTGSEVSPNVVLDAGEEKRFLNSSFFYPDIGLVDPLLTLSMPPHITAMTGIDAVSHAVEGVLHKQANPFNTAFALTGIELAGKYLRRAVADGEDLEARYYMAMSSTLCMMAMAMTRAGYAHSAAYVIAKYKHSPHGLTCGLALPYAMAFNLPVCVEPLARIGEALGEKTWMLSRLDAAHLAVQAVANLMEDVGLPVTLEEFGGIDEGNLEDMAGIMIKLYHRAENPRPMGLPESVQFWQNMWDGIF
jgi:alcohol dehydrogenase